MSAWWEDTAGLWIFGAWAAGGLASVATGSIIWWVLAYVVCGAILLALRD